jgi:hypothetical protein
VPDRRHLVADRDRPDHDLAAPAADRDQAGLGNSAIVAHEKVGEAAVVAQSDELTGQAIVAFVTLQGDRVGDAEIEAEVREHVAERIGKLARPKRILWTEDLPKTRSGKIMRRLLRDIADGRALGDVTTLRDPAVMAELEAKVAGQDRLRRPVEGAHVSTDHDEAALRLDEPAEVTDSPSVGTNS